MGKKADRVVTRLLAASLLHVAGAIGVSAEEFRTPSISAVRVEWRAVVDQLRSEIGTQPSVAQAFTFASQRRVPAHDPRSTPALVQLNAPVFGIICAKENDRLSQVKVGQVFERIYLTATALGIRLQPMSQLTAVPEIRAELADLIPKKDTFPQQPFRLGYAEAEGSHTPRRSP